MTKTSALPVIDGALDGSEMMVGYAPAAAVKDVLIPTSRVVLPDSVQTLSNKTLSTLVVGEFGSQVSRVQLWRGDLDPGTVVAGNGTTLTAAIANTAINDFVSASVPGILADGLLVRGWISSVGTLSVRFFNATAADITPGSVTVNALIANIL